ncbi:MAG: Crp/Fnr family transcriptional regulator [Candidatus Acidiferrum sp.]
MFNKLPLPLKSSLRPQSDRVASVRRVLTRPGRDAVTGEHDECLRQLAIFSNLSPVDCREILAAAREKRFLRREVVFLEGVPCRQVLLVLSGCIKTTQLGPTGCEVMLRLSGPGELVGALESYLGTNNLLTARTTQQPTTALVWDASTFESLSDRYPNLRRNTTRFLGLCLQQLEERFREISTQRVAPRLSSQLIRLSNQMRPHTKGVLEIGLSREELAQLTGTTLFTVSRLLSEWERLGIVNTRREAVIVQNFQALIELSEAG